MTIIFDDLQTLVEDFSNTNVGNGSISPSASTEDLNTPGTLQASPVTDNDYRVKLTLAGNGDNTLPVGIYKLRVKVNLAPE